jgi:Pyruvate/2-oxoacid:ferredoxin oxidoreductase delta subunit
VCSYDEFHIYQYIKGCHICGGSSIQECVNVIIISGPEKQKGVSTILS